MATIVDAMPVVWITGLAGAGKTTVAEMVSAELRRAHANVIVLDGDGVREACGNDLGHSPDERLKNAQRLCRLARYLNRQGHIVVCATMSLFPEIWELNRRTLPNYLEVYLRVTMATLAARDKKGLYSAPARETSVHVVGRDLDFIEPATADLVLDNDAADALAANAARVAQAVEARITPVPQVHREAR